MGMRSQIYVRYDQENGKGLIAHYYQWNYTERMISRARHSIESIINTLQYDWYYKSECNVVRLSRILDVNFDMCDYQLSSDIISEFKECGSGETFRQFVFEEQDNNDGKLLIDIGTNEVKYAFLDSNANPDNIMDAEAYVFWDNGNAKITETTGLPKSAIATCNRNIKYISEHAKLMTRDEVEEFLSYNYLV
jgi:hypothetical protein